MIIIQKNGFSTIIVTASEMTDYDEPSFIISFKNKQTNEVVFCTVPDTSLFKNRYNLLTIKDTPNPISLDGEVDLKIGYHEYTCLSLSGAVLERGLALVIWNRQSVTSHQNNNINIVYEKTT